MAGAAYVFEVYNFVTSPPPRLDDCNESCPAVIVKHNWNVKFFKLFIPVLLLLSSCLKIFSRKKEL